MKKNMMIAMAGVLAAATAVSGISIAASAEEGPVEITYTSRGNADEIKVYQQAVDAFNESQDRIHVTFEASPSDGYSQQLKAERRLTLFLWRIRLSTSLLKMVRLPTFRISWRGKLLMQKKKTLMRRY